MFDIASLAASAGARIASAHSALMPRRAIVPPHYTRERLLRDIGLSRSDIINGLSNRAGRGPHIRW